jgi:hypothetical protein
MKMMKNALGGSSSGGLCRTPEPTSLGMTHLSDDEEDNRQRSSSPPAPIQPAVLDELFQPLMTLSAQLQSTVELRRLCKPSTPLRRTPSRRSNLKYRCSRGRFYTIPLTRRVDLFPTVYRPTQPRLHSLLLVRRSRRC